MKMRVLLLSLTLFLWSQVTSAKIFLTYNEYYALTPQKQSEYIKAVRELAMSLENNPNLATEAKRTSHLYVYFLEKLLHQVEASALSEVCDVQSVEHFSEDELLSKIEQMMNCSEKSGPNKPNYFIHVVPRSAVVLSNEYKKRLESGALNRRSLRVQEASGIFSAVLSDINKGVILGGGQFIQQGEAISQNVKMAEGILAQPLSSSKSLKASLASKHSLPSNPRSGKLTSDSLCIYAGFVILKKDRPTCQALSQLPKSFESSFFDLQTFVCDRQAPVLCNPLLFGFVSLCDSNEIQPCYNKKPLCISKSSSATKKCYELAQSKNTLSTVEDVWKSPSGEALYKEYTDSLQSLCDSQKINNRQLSKRAKIDITQTCQVAFDLFQDHVDRKFLPRIQKDVDSQSQK